MIGMRLRVIAHSNLNLGTAVINEMRDAWVIGEFEPGSDFAPYKALFEEWGELVSSVQLTGVDELDTEIRNLGIRLLDSGGNSLAYEDIQIYLNEPSCSICLKIPIGMFPLCGAES